MNTAAGAWLRTAGAAGVCESLWLSDAVAGPAGDAPARPPQGRRVWVLAAPRGRARSPGPEPLGIPGVPAPQPEDSSTALAAASFQPPGGLGCAARDVAGAASAPGTSARDAPRPAPPAQLPFPCPPQPGGQCRCSCRLGRPGYCSGPAAVPALSDKRPSPHGRRGGGPGQLAPRGGGAPRHREKLLGGAEAVGGGRRRWVGEAIALLSPKSKVLGAVSRAPSGGSRGRLLRAGLRLLQETRQPAPASLLPPPRWDECA